jgi:hypothetical protein
MYRSRHHEMDLHSGILVLETYRLDGKLHREPKDGPAYIRRSDEGFGIIEERYYWRGKLHRENGPAYILYADNQLILEEEYYHRHGVISRDPKEGPAWVEYFDGVKVNEEYVLNGVRYRDPADGPCYISRSFDGTVHLQEFSKPGAVRPTRHPSRRPLLGPKAEPTS